MPPGSAPPLMVGVASFVTPSVSERPVSLPVVRPALGASGGVVSFTVMSTVSSSLFAPPVPVLPRSSVETLSVAVPW